MGHLLGPIFLLLDTNLQPAGAIDRRVFPIRADLAPIEPVFRADRSMEVVLQPGHQQHAARLSLHPEVLPDPIPTQSPLLVRHDHRHVQMRSRLVLVQRAMGYSRSLARPLLDPPRAVRRPAPDLSTRPGVLRVVARRSSEDPGRAPHRLPAPCLLPPAFLHVFLRFGRACLRGCEIDLLALIIEKDHRLELFFDPIRTDEHSGSGCLGAFSVPVDMLAESPASTLDPFHANNLRGHSAEYTAP